MAEALSVEQLQCCICLDIFTKPVSIPCGHNFCLQCIQTYWDRKKEAECPLCKEVFHHKPSPRVNPGLRDIVETFKRSLKVKREQGDDGTNRRSVAGATETETQSQGVQSSQVECDICPPGAKLQAARSCLVCQASYCRTHLNPHRSDADLQGHRLTDPATFPDRGLCRIHRRPLGLFCRKEKTLVCTHCKEAEHRGHDTVAVETETGRIKDELKKAETLFQEMVQTRLQKADEITGRLRMGKEAMDRDVEASVEVFAELTRFISGGQAGLLEELEQMKATKDRKAARMTEELEEEITELMRRLSELQALQQTQEHLHLLQSFPSVRIPPSFINWSKVSLPSCISVGAVRRAVSKMVDTCRELEKKLCVQELLVISQHADNVVLDVATASPWLVLSPDRKQVSLGCKLNPNLLPSDPQRFDMCPCVLGKPHFTAGRHSWVVQVGDKSDWDLGVARESINRKGSITVRPINGYWAICRRKGGGLSAGPTVQLQIPGAAPRKVCIFLDYQEGMVSFYDADAKTHIHTYSGCDFAAPLCPYFNPCLHYNGRNTAPLIICPFEGQGQSPSHVPAAMVTRF